MMQVAIWNVNNFPGRNLFSSRPGVAAMLAQELDRLAEAMGESHGTGVWSDAAAVKLTARARIDPGYLAPLRRAKGERHPRKGRGQAPAKGRSLLDVIKEELAARRVIPAPFAGAGNESWAWQG